ncbi:hypothetical protein [Legionella tunisiensis]|uniref:hypothetical protein n=1 Tax=Legionella tunisiensis TaxID=1034944 RepID=UPI000365559D
MGDQSFLAVAQFAKDLPGRNAGLDGGDSDHYSLIYRWDGSKFRVFQKIPSHGGRDLEYFQIDKKSFIALANLRAGSGPYIRTYSTIYTWDGCKFTPIQNIATNAAQEWTSFKIKDTTYLAVANYAKVGKRGPDFNTNSVIYRWNGEQFTAIQSIPTYGIFTWEFFTIKSKHYLAAANGAGKTSVIYQWDGKQFNPVQNITAPNARDIKFFTLNNQHYLAVANLGGDSAIYQWNGMKFELFQTIQGKGGRRFIVFERKGLVYLVKINYQIDNNVKLKSQIYVWNGNRFDLTTEFPTSGATDASYFTLNGHDYLAVSNGHKSKTSFRIDSVIYEVK